MASNVRIIVSHDKGEVCLVIGTRFGGKGRFQNDTFIIDSKTAFDVAVELLKHAAQAEDKC